jgi:uncharacterized protein (DUF2236 family)
MTVREPIRHVERPIADPPVRGFAPRRSALLRRAGIDDRLMAVALLAGPANVTVQLARPGGGYWVLESRVERDRPAPD